MERISAQDGEDGGIATRSAQPNREALPSRTTARATIRASIDSGSGFWVLTGDAGVGKTWTWRGLVESGGHHRETWLFVEVTPGLTADQFYSHLTNMVGLSEGRSPREAFRQWLDVRSLDGERTVLVVEECHNAEADLLEEARILANQLELASGLTSIGLVGQTSLLRRLTSRAYWPLASRLSAKVHLRSLDADEVTHYLSILAPRQTWTSAQAEDWQVTTAGNPRLIRQKISMLATRKPRFESPNEAEKVSPIPTPLVMAAVPSLLGATRPPIRLEEGVIEVGWQPGQPSEAAEDSIGEGSEQAVNDHYAALQAWNEWSRAQEPTPVVAHPPPIQTVSKPDLSDLEDDEEESYTEVTPWVRADEQHGFSPFSPMFSRLKRATDAE